MFSFALRVELLNNATWDDYSRLHQRLANVGFYPFVIADNGQRFALPPGQYARTAAVSLPAARQQAEQAVRGGLRPGLFVCQMTGWMGNNLAAA
jgi:hypothetical protein